MPATEALPISDSASRLDTQTAFLSIGCLVQCPGPLFIRTNITIATRKGGGFSEHAGNPANPDVIRSVPKGEIQSPQARIGGAESNSATIIRHRKEARISIVQASKAA